MNHDIMPETLKAKFPLKLKICVLEGQVQVKGLQRYGCTQVVAMFLHSWYYDGMPSHIPSPLTCGPQIPWKPWWTREQHWSLYLTRHETIWLLGDIMDFFRQMWFWLIKDPWNFTSWKNSSAEKLGIFKMELLTLLYKMSNLPSGVFYQTHWVNGKSQLL